MKTFKGYINEDFKELVKISCAVDPTNSKKFEALLKKMVFGYNGPMDKSRYADLGLDEFIIVGPNTPVMKWVSKYKSMIIKLAKLPMPKITFASVDVNQYDGENLFEAKLTATKDFYKTAMSKKQKDEFDKLYKKLDGGKEHQNIKRKIKNPVKADDHFHALVMKRIIGDKRSSFDSKEAFGEAILQEKFLQDLLTPNEFKDELEQEMKDAGYSPKVIKKITKKGKGYEVRITDLKGSIQGDMKNIFTNMGASKINFKKGGGVMTMMVEAINHPAYINVTLQDFAKHMKRIKPHAKKAGTKLTVQGKDVKVDGLATAIKKMFDYMTSDGKGFYE